MDFETQNYSIEEDDFSQDENFSVGVERGADQRDDLDDKVDERVRYGDKPAEGLGKDSNEDVLKDLIPEKLAGAGAAPEAIKYISRYESDEDWVKLPDGPDAQSTFMLNAEGEWTEITPDGQLINHTKQIRESGDAQKISEHESKLDKLKTKGFFVEENQNGKGINMDIRDPKMAFDTMGVQATIAYVGTDGSINYATYDYKPAQKQETIENSDNIYIDDVFDLQTAKSLESDSDEEPDYDMVQQVSAERNDLKNIETVNPASVLNIPILLQKTEAVTVVPLPQEKPSVIPEIVFAPVMRVPEPVLEQVQELIEEKGQTEIQYELVTAPVQNDQEVVILEANDSGISLEQDDAEDLGVVDKPQETSSEAFFLENTFFGSSQEDIAEAGHENIEPTVTLEYLGQEAEKIEAFVSAQPGIEEDSGLLAEESGISVTGLEYSGKVESAVKNDKEVVADSGLTIIKENINTADLAIKEEQAEVSRFESSLLAQEELKSEKDEITVEIQSLPDVESISGSVVEKAENEIEIQELVEDLEQVSIKEAEQIGEQQKEYGEFSGIELVEFFGEEVSEIIYRPEAESTDPVSQQQDAKLAEMFGNWSSKNQEKQEVNFGISLVEEKSAEDATKQLVNETAGLAVLNVSPEIIAERTENINKFPERAANKATAEKFGGITLVRPEKNEPKKQAGAKLVQTAKPKLAPVYRQERREQELPKPDQVKVEKLREKAFDQQPLAGRIQPKNFQERVPEKTVLYSEGQSVKINTPSLEAASGNVQRFVNDRVRSRQPIYIDSTRANSAFVAAGRVAGVTQRTARPSARMEVVRQPALRNYAGSGISLIDDQDTNSVIERRGEELERVV